MTMEERFDEMTAPGKFPSKEKVKSFIRDEINLALESAAKEIDGMVTEGDDQMVINLFDQAASRVRGMITQ